MIDGNFEMDASSTLSLAQVAALATPLMVIQGSASFSGVISFTLDSNQPLLAPLIVVEGSATITATIVITIGSAYTTEVIAAL